MTDGANQKVKIENGDLDNQTHELLSGFEAFTAPVITGFTPNPSYGFSLDDTPNGDSIATLTITGTNLEKVNSVTIGGVTCSNVASVTETSFACDRPVTLSSGTHAIIATDVFSETSNTNITVVYNPLPTVTSINPVTGPTASTKSVTITGSNFINDAGTSVMVGDANCGSISVDSATQITCTVASGATEGLSNVVVTNADGQVATGSNLYTFIEAPEISSIVNSEAIADINGAKPTGYKRVGSSAAGSEVIRIEGDHFRAGTTVTIGGDPCSINSIDTASTPEVILCNSPAKAETSPETTGYALVVTNDDADSQSVTSTHNVVYYNTPSITNVSPSNVSINHENEPGTPFVITVNGTDLIKTHTIDINGNACTNLVVGETSVTCERPAGLAAGTYTLTVTDVFGNTDTTSITYNPVPTISSISESVGKTSGGTTLTITGTNFIDGLSVKTEGGTDLCTDATPTVTGGTSIACTTASIAPGVYDVVVKNPDTQSVTSTDAFEFLANLTISSVSPSFNPFNNTSDAFDGTSVYPAPDVGNHTVTLTGTGFHNDGSNFDININGTDCAIIAVNGARTEVTCTSPDLAPGGPYLIDMTNGDPDLQTANFNGMTYYAVPTVSEVTANGIHSPAIASTASGTVITIDGTNLTLVSTVTIGGTACTVTNVTATQIQCTAPSKTTGTYDVVVTDATGQAATLSSSIFVRPEPTLTNVNPNDGPSDTSQAITLTGTNFFSSAAIQFSTDSFSTVVDCQNENTGAATTTSPVTTMTCDAPGGMTAGVYEVKVVNQDAQEVIGSVSEQYTVYASPNISSVDPSYLGLTGGAIKVIGTDFESGMTVTVDGQTCASPTVSNGGTNIDCTAPNLGTAGAYDVVVTNPLTSQTDTLVGGISYNAVPTISNVTPSGGTKDGGTSIVISGSNFIVSPVPVVTVGGNTCNVTSNNNSQIQCDTPAGIVGTQDVVVLNDDGQSVTSANAFEYFNPPTISSISPTNGKMTIGTSLTINGSNFSDPMTVKVDPAGANLDCNTVTVVNAGEITCTLPSAPSSTSGEYVIRVISNDGLSDDLTGYTYNPVPTITNVSPTSGGVSENKAINITGTNFLSGATVDAGGTCTSVNVVSPTLITCFTPSHAAGAVNITVTNPDTQSVVENSGFTYVEVPTIASVTNQTTNTSNGPLAMSPAHVLRITGTGFTDPTTVTIDGITCSSPTVVNSTTIDCNIPDTAPVNDSGAKDVAISDSFSQSATLTGGYTYNPLPVYSSITPSSGVLTGGTSVTISGNYFIETPSVPSVTIGGIACTGVSFTNATELTCTTGDATGSPGAKDVVIANYDGQDVTGSSAYTYIPKPNPTAIDPDNGSKAGGQTVTISGTNFQTSGSTTVTIGGANCTSVNVTDATTLTCNTPAIASAGAKNIVVTNPDSQTGTLTAGFTVNDDPTITSVSSPSPAEGSTAGGTAITIAGTNFLGAPFSSDPNPTVTIAGNACSSISVTSATELSCSTPAGTPGAADVVITNWDGQTATLTSGFTYISPPTVSLATPGSGKIAGGTSVTITGSNFSGDATVKIGTKDCTSVVHTSSTELSCTLPDNVSAGTENVVVTNVSTGLIGTKVGGYTYNPFPTISSVTPSAGPTDVSTTLTINGTGFIESIGASNIGVTVGGVTCSNITFVNDSQLTCDAAAGQPAGAKDVVLTNPDTQAVTASGAFDYILPQADKTLSTIVLSSNKAPHDGIAEVKVYVVLRNSAGQLVGTGKDVEIFIDRAAPTLTGSGTSCSLPTNPQENWNVGLDKCVDAVDAGGGIYTATITSTSIFSSVKVYARVNGSPITWLDEIESIHFDTGNFTEISSDTTINNTHSGQDLYITAGSHIVDDGGGTLTLGTVLISGSTLTHDASTTSSIKSMNLSVDSFYVKDSTLTASGKGFPAGYSRSNSGPSSTLAASNEAGASHGGRGGYKSSGAVADAGPTYGYFYDPSAPGSGSALAAGGGIIKINSAGACLLTGTTTIDANGSSGSAGGSINFSCELIGGSIALDSIQANGGAATASQAGGGGGRIALKTTTDEGGFVEDFLFPNSSSTLTSFLANIESKGGSAFNSTYADGGAGTIFLKHSGLTYGALVINNELTSSYANTGATLIPSIEGTVTVANTTDMSLNITSNPDFDSNEYTNVLNSYSIRPNVSYNAGDADDWTDDGMIRQITSHGTTTFNVDSAITNTTAADTFRSIFLLDHLEVLGGSVMESNGDFYITDGKLSAPNPSAPSLDFPDSYLKFNGGAGIKPPVGSLTITSGTFIFSDLVVENLNVSGGTIEANSIVADSVTISGGSITAPSVTVNSGGNLNVSSGTLISESIDIQGGDFILMGGTIAQPASSVSEIKKLEISVVGEFSISGGLIDARGKGYPAGRSYHSTSSSTALASINAAGASHGGLGGYLLSGAATDVGTTYGNYRNPNTPGAGGDGVTSIGGGIIRISVTGSTTACTFDGGSVDASADGNGAGGSIYVSCEDGFQGAGSSDLIIAKGGSAVDGAKAGGGGGRIALISSAAQSSFTAGSAFAWPVDQGSYNTFVANVSARGGLADDQNEPGGGAGTIFLMHSGITNGSLIVDNTGVTSYENGGTTFLPSFAGTVASIASDEITISSIVTSPAITTDFVNLYAGVKIRPDIDCSGTPDCSDTDLSDDNIKTIESNTHNVLNLVEGTTETSAAKEFRTVEILDYLDVGGAATITTNGDIWFSSGSLVDGGSNLKFNSGLIAFNDAGGLAPAPNIFPYSPALSLNSGVFSLGTIFSTSLQVNGATVTANSITLSGDITISAGSLIVDSINAQNVILSGGTLQSESITTTSDLTITSGTLTHPASTNSELKKLDITVGGDFSISGGSIDLNEKGYPSGYSYGSSGPATYFAASNDAGGSHGGLGGYTSGGDWADAGHTYGNYRYPVYPGSGSNVSITSAGGGVLDLDVTGSCSFDSASNLSANGAIAAAGGSIYLNCGTLNALNTFTGLISASGGAANGSNAGGGGGRIALVSDGTSTSFSNKLTIPVDQASLDTVRGVLRASGGAGLSSAVPGGGAGSVYLDHSGITNGFLLVDNNNNTAYPTTGKTLLLSLYGTVNGSPGANSLPINVTSNVSLDSNYNDLFTGMLLRPDLTNDNSTSGDWTDDSHVEVLSNLSTSITTTGSSPDLTGFVSNGENFRSIDILDRLEITGNAYLETNGDIAVTDGTLASPSASRLTFNNGVYLQNGTSAINPERPDFSFSTLDFEISTLQANDIAILNSANEINSIDANNLTVSGGTSTLTNITLSGNWTQSGGTVTHPVSTTTNEITMNATIGGAFTHTGGTINVDEKGYPSGYSFGASGPSTSLIASSGAGASHGGFGGYTASGAILDAGVTYGNYREPLKPGAGGLGGTYGGGALKFVVTEGCQIDNGATISANGGNTSAGGSIFFTCDNFSGTAATNAIRANGGIAVDTTASGGGGGRIALVATESGADGTSGAGDFTGNFTFPTNSTQFNALIGVLNTFGGDPVNSTYPGGGAGTIFLKHTSTTYGALIVNNNLQTYHPTTGTTFLPSIIGKATATPDTSTIEFVSQGSLTLDSTYNNLFAGMTLRPDIDFDSGSDSDWTNDNIIEVASNSATSITAISPYSTGDVTLNVDGKFKSIDMLDYMDVVGNSIVDTDGDLVVQSGSLITSAPAKLSRNGSINNDLDEIQATNTVQIELSIGEYRTSLLSADSIIINGATVYADRVEATGTITVQSGTLEAKEIVATDFIINGGTVTHPPTTQSIVNRLEITVSNHFTMNGGTINLDSRGYLDGYSYGDGTPSTNLASSNNSGGSHGGRGGFLATGSKSDASPTYGDFRDPRFPGSGGLAASGNVGGGVLIVNATETCSVNSGAIITADGGPTAAGGSINLRCKTFSGTMDNSAISAHGGNADGTTSGGGGGRIALVSSDGVNGIAAFTGNFDYPEGQVSLDALKGRIESFGGDQTSATIASGGAGTIYLKHGSETYGSLIVTNRSAAESEFNTGATVLPGVVGTVSGAPSGQTITFTNTAAEAPTATHTNLFDGVWLRGDISYTAGGAGIHDDGVAEITSNTSSTLTVSGDISHVDDGDSLRSLTILDTLHISDGAVIESVGDIAVLGGNTENPGGSPLSFTNGFLRNLGSSDVEPSNPDVSLLSGDYFYENLRVEDLVVNGAIVSGGTITSSADVTISSGKLTNSQATVGGNALVSGGEFDSQVMNITGNMSITGGTVYHPTATTSASYVLDWTIGGNYTHSGGTINLLELGYPQGYSFGSSAPATNLSSSNSAGGSHGGTGGILNSGSTSDRGFAYGSYRDPKAPGAGAGGGSGGSGGGVLYVTTTGACNIDSPAKVDARGGTAAAGGSIRFQCNGIGGSAGASALDTRGGNSTTVDGGGGGGRIALISTGNQASFTGSFAYPTDGSTTTSFLNVVNAKGGSYASGFTSSGGAGTIFIKHSDESFGSLLINNLGTANAEQNSGSTFLPSLVGTVNGDHTTSTSTLAINVTSSPGFSSAFTDVYRGMKVRPDISVQNDNDWSDDNIIEVASNGASSLNTVAAFSGVSDGASLRTIELLDHLYIGGSAVLETNGDIWVKEGPLDSPGVDNRLAFNEGILRLNGTTNTAAAAVYPEDPDTTLTGGAFDVQILDVRNLTATNTVLENSNIASSGDVTFNTSTIDSANLEAINLSVDGGIVTLQNITTTNDFNILSGTVNHPETTATDIYRIVATVGGNFSFTSGSINLDGRGFLEGYSYGNGTPSTALGTTGFAGGSHGGLGGFATGGQASQAGITFGKYRAPIKVGAGGNSNTTSDGGGAIQLTATGSCSIDSGASITASGEAGAAGGSIFLTCGSFSGTAATNALLANGGNATDGATAGGGGGRISLVSTGNATTWSGSFSYPVDPSSLTNFMTKVRTWGGRAASGNEANYPSGGAGTIYLQHKGLANGSTYGAMLIDNGTSGEAYPNSGTTLLPSASGTVSSTPIDANLSISVASTPSLTANMVDLLEGVKIRSDVGFDNSTPNDWSDDAVKEIQSHSNTNFVLDSQATESSSGETFRTIDFLDNIYVGGGATLESNGDVYVFDGTIDSPGNTSLSLANASLKLNDGAQIYPPNPDISITNGEFVMNTLDVDDLTISGGTVNVPDINATGSVTISGGVVTSQTIDATGDLTISGGQLNHPATTAASDYRLKISLGGNFSITGGTIDLDGLGYGSRYSFGANAPATSLASTSFSGGSHGGTGGSVNASDNAGVTYGNYRAPLYPGSGPGTPVDGYAGGGALQVTASGICTLDSGGTITADGQLGASGGSLFFTCGGFAGTADGETLTATGGNGGDDSSANPISAGGGGRVALVSTGNSSSFSGNMAYPTGVNLTSFLNIVRANGGSKHATNAAYHSGGAGTIFVKHSDLNYGSLIVDNQDITVNTETPGQTALPSLMGTLDQAPNNAGANAILDVTASEGILNSNYTNLYVGMQLRADVSYDASTPNTWSDDEVLTVESNDADTLTVDLGAVTQATSGETFRTIHLLDHLEITGGAVLATHGDIEVKSGSLVQNSLGARLAFEDGVHAFTNTQAAMNPDDPDITLNQGVYRLDRVKFRDLNVSGANSYIASLDSSRDVTISSGSLHSNLLTIDNNLSISGGVFTQIPSTTTVTKILDVTVGGAFSITGGQINLDGKGYPAGYSYGMNGPSTVFVANGTVSAGSSHGGLGGYGTGTSSDAGQAYGSYRKPNLPGAGGALATSQNGGGALVLTSTGTCTVDSGATISANGEQSAAGGSLYLTCSGFAGTAGAAALSANGGNGFNNGSDYSGGGGGRISLVSTGNETSFAGSFDFPNNQTELDNLKVVINSYGGLSGAGNIEAGGAGTIFLDHTGIADGALIIDNGSRSSVTSKSGVTYLPSLSGSVNATTTGGQFTLPVSVSSSPGLNSDFSDLYKEMLIRIGARDADWSDDAYYTVSANSNTQLTLSTSLSSDVNGESFRTVDRVTHIDIGGSSIVTSNGDLYVTNGELSSPGVSQLSFTNGLIYFNAGGQAEQADIDFILQSGEFNVGSIDAQNLTVAGADLFAASSTVDNLSVTSGTATITSVTAGTYTLSGGTTTHEILNVNAGNLTIDGGTMTHPVNVTGSGLKKLSVQITSGNLEVTNGGKIDVSEKGYSATYGYGNLTSMGSAAGNGASHGGLGGLSVGGGALGTTFGNYRDPQTPGGGGNAGLGGGAVRIEASGTCMINSTSGIYANGNLSGAGGSIGLFCSGFDGDAGTGAISANGGNANASNAGGGGGRIALVSSAAETSFNSTSSFDYPISTALSGFKLTVRARGGSGFDADYPGGGAGTIFAQHSGSTNGALIVDNGNQDIYPNSGSTLLVSVSGTVQTIPSTTQVTIAPDQTLSADHADIFAETQISLDTTIGNGTATDPSDDNLLTVSSNTSGSITVSTTHSNVDIGDSFRTVDVLDHIDIAQNGILETHGDLYVLSGRLASPADPVSTPMEWNNGLVAFRNGGQLKSGAGNLTIDTNVLDVNKSISYSNVTINSGTFKQNSATFSGTLSITGGTVSFGTLNTTGIASFSGGTIIATDFNATSDVTISGATLSNHELDVGGNLTISSGTLTHPATTSTTVDSDWGLIAQVSGNFVLSGGSIDVSSKGFPLGYSYGPGQASIAVAASSYHGGSHGGEGGDDGSTTATTYGNYKDPKFPGAGAGTGATGSAGSGGGVVYMTTSGNCTFSSGSTINANGGPGAAGGSIYLQCASFGGTLDSAHITANGGNASDGEYSAGGGGRIALITPGDLTNWQDDFAYYSALTGVDDTTTFNTFKDSVQARGGDGFDATYANGGAGTVYLKNSDLTYGDVYIDNAKSTTYANDGETIFIGTTVNSTQIRERTSSTEVKVQQTGSPFANINDLFEGATIQVWSGSSILSPLVRGGTEHLLSGNGSNSFKQATASPSFPAISENDHQYRFLYRIDRLNISGKSQVDMSKADLILIHCGYNTTTTSLEEDFIVPTGSQLDINHVASAKCKNSCFVSQSGSTINYAYKNLPNTDACN